MDTLKSLESLYRGCKQHSNNGPAKVNLLQRAEIADRIVKKFNGDIQAAANHMNVGVTVLRQSWALHHLPKKVQKLIVRGDLRLESANRLLEFLINEVRIRLFLELAEDEIDRQGALTASDIKYLISTVRSEEEELNNNGRCDFLPNPEDTAEIDELGIPKNLPIYRITGNGGLSGRLCVKDRYSIEGYHDRARALNLQAEEVPIIVFIGSGCKPSPSKIKRDNLQLIWPGESQDDTK